MCRQQHWEGGDCFDCRLIAKVRADEREHTAFLHEALLRNQLADLRAQVEALPTYVKEPDEREYLILSDMLALFDGSSR